MKRKILDLKVAPRWLVQMFDAIIVCLSFAISYFIIERFEFEVISRGHFFIYTGSYVLNSAIVFYCMGIHKGIIRHSNIMDLARIFVAVAITGILYMLVLKSVIEVIFNFHSLEVEKVLFVNFFICSSILVFIRAGVRETFQFARRVAPMHCENVLIYGDSKDSLLIKAGLEHASGTLFNVVGFVVANKNIKNNYIEQKRVFHIDDLSKLKIKSKVDKLVLSQSALPSVERKSVIDGCLQAGIKIATIAPPKQWISGGLNIRHLQDLKIEDVLQREAIRIDNCRIKDEIAGKRVLVTGGAGSIGTELVRQLLQYSPSRVIVCDMAETALYDLQIALNDEFPGNEVKFFIGNVQNSSRMQRLFEEHQPQVVFHAAAYKHVPLMEDNPSEAVLANVLGTKNIAELAIRFKVEKFVMVSTDKAVNPSNIMGASKRIAELLVQSLDEERKTNRSSTKFVTTRFGNVLGSQGSVLPRFKAQISRGGPVTVTHPEIIRYFMTIPEAVRLVLEAATMAEGGEVYVFDMGKPVKIVDLAVQMIKLAGLEPDEDIKIQFTGLRPGEKLYEELLGDEEKTTPTYHEKIKIAHVNSRSLVELLPEIQKLIRVCQFDDDMHVASIMKQLVPEFISKNSAYEYLDYVKRIKLVSDQLQPEEELNSIPSAPRISGKPESRSA